MTMRRGYCLVPGLTLLVLPACVGYPQPTGDLTLQSLTGGTSVSASRSAAGGPSVPAPLLPPPVPLVTMPASPLIDQTRHEAKTPPIAPPVVLEPTGPIVEMRPIEPNDPPDSMLVEAVRNFESRRPQQGAAKLAGCDGASREMLARLLPLAVGLSDGSVSRADPQDLAALIEQFNAALAPLRARAAMEMPKLCFCRPRAAPARFGAYEPLEENHRFRPGETVGLYMELKNFTCLPRDRDFATQVTSSVEIRDAAGAVVFRFDCERTEPSLSPRQDYCHFGRFALPALPPGAYTLWLKATDTPTGRSALRSLDFRVTSEKS